MGNEFYFVHETNGVANFDFQVFRLKNKWIFSNSSDAHFGFFMVESQEDGDFCPNGDRTRWFYANDGVWRPTDKISFTNTKLEPTLNDWKCDCYEHDEYTARVTNMQ